MKPNVFYIDHSQVLKLKLRYSRRILENYEKLRKIFEHSIQFEKTALRDGASTKADREEICEGIVFGLKQLCKVVKNDIP